MKKGLSVLLTAVFLLTLLAVPASASDNTFGDYRYRISYLNNTASITWYTGSASELVIPAEIDGYTVTGIGKGVFANRNSLISVSIPDSVTSIGEHAFEYCSSLKEINLPDSVTEIAYCTFAGCRSLTSIAIPDSVTVIDKEAFMGCSVLSSVSIGNSVTRIETNAFLGCPLTSVTLPDSVTSINGEAFLSCKSMTSVVIPSSVTFIGIRAFGYYSENGYKKLDGFTILGYSGTEAENYANNYGFTFIAIDHLLCGDADGDGDITILDATSIQRKLAEIPVQAYVEAAADADGDGEVTILDTTSIQRYLAVLPTFDGIGKPLV